MIVKLRDMLQIDKKSHHIIFIIAQISIFLLMLSGLHSCNENTAGPAIPTAQKGVLDLRNWNLYEQGNLSLTGEWEFYWQHFLLSDHAPSKNGSVLLARGTPGFIKLPGLWQELNNQEGSSLPRDGYASFRLTVLLDKNYENLALQFKEKTNPLRAFVNGKLISRIGVPGNSLAAETYDSFPHFAYFVPQSQRLDIVLEVSNFHFPRSAGLKPVILGTADRVRRNWELLLVRDAVFVGCIFIIGLYFFVLFIFNHSTFEKVYIYFGIFCIAFAFRALLMGNMFFNQLFPDISWVARSRLINLSLYIAVPALVSYIFIVFYKDFPQKPIPAFYVFYGILIVFNLTFPFPAFSWTMHPHHLFVIVTSSYIIYTLVKASIRKQKGALFFLINSCLFYLFIVHDVLVYYTVINGDYQLLLGFTIFLLSQIYFISQHMHELNEKIRKLSDDLISRTFDLYQIRKDEQFIEQSEFEYFCRNYQLSNREHEVLWLVIQGCKNKEIAEKLFISFFTVRRHLSNIYFKIGLSDRDTLLKEILRYKN